MFYNVYLFTYYVMAVQTSISLYNLLFKIFDFPKQIYLCITVLFHCVLIHDHVATIVFILFAIFLTQTFLSLSP